MAEQDLLYHVADRVATITVNRPESRNSFTWEMWDRLRDLAGRAGADPAVRVIVVKGAGGRAFAAGADIRQMAEIELAAWQEGRRRLSAALDALLHLEKPVIAQIQGYALGGGLELALACDLRYATPDSRFGIPAGKLGIVISLENFRRLVALVGPARTSDLVYTARQVPADEAAAMGLVNAVVPAEELEERVRAVVDQICACSPAATAGSKRSIAHCLSAPDPDPEMFAVKAFQSGEFRQGVRAFLEKRVPDWN